MDQQISIGRIVIFRLTALQADEINRRRTTCGSIQARLAGGSLSIKSWPEGAQAHIGNLVTEGMEFPMIVVRQWPGMNYVNGQVMLDGTDALWVTSAIEGQENGQWHWPKRA